MQGQRPGRGFRDRLALQQRFARRFGRDHWFEAFETLRHQGEEIEAIAQLGGITSRTLYRWLAAHSLLSNGTATDPKPEQVPA